MIAAIIMGLQVGPRVMDTAQNNRGTRRHHLPYPRFCPNYEGPPSDSRYMEHTTAMQIVGGVALLIGLRMNIDPVGFNKSIFGDVEGIESGESSAMRMAIGGGLLALAMVNIYCSFNVDDAAAGEAVLTGTAMGLAAFFVTVAAPKFRGYTDSIPTLPMVVLPTMIAICLYSALM